MKTQIHATPISARPVSPLAPLRKYTLTLLWSLFFLCIHLGQLLLSPMSLVPGGIRSMYWDYIRYTKEVFVRCLVFLASDTTIVVTAGEGVELEECLEKDERGRVVGFKFGKRAVWISNHQQYADWIYTWVLMYMAELHGGVVIILKKSLRWIPIGGPAMQLWNFVFLAQSWETDRGPMGKNLSTLGWRAKKQDKSLALLVYPEGTLVSSLTRPGSAKFAAKSGVTDMKNLLLPRSTGLLFCLRSLLAVDSETALYDLTIGYPGVPKAGYAQAHYTLASIFSEGQAPPTVHIHIRAFKMDDVPTGKIDSVLSADLLDKALTIEEKTTFSDWLRERWSEKDVLMDTFYETGEFPVEKETQRVEMKIGFKDTFDDSLAIATTFAPLYAAYRIARRTFF